MKKKSYFIKAMFSYIVMVAILGMVIIMGNTASAQITWPDAEVFNIPSSGFNGITANSFTTYGSKTGGDIFIITEGSSSLLHNSAMSVSNCVGGIGSKLEGIYYRIRHASDLSIIYEEINSTIAIPIAIKGDTLVYNSSFSSFLKIGSSDPVELVGVTGTVKGYVIMNGHIFVYTFVSATTETRIYDFTIQDLSNPLITTEIGASTDIITFLDNYQLKYKIGAGAGYYFNDGTGWQIIDNSMFGGVYSDLALSYYDQNSDLCITCLKTSNGDLRQIYTEGFPSDENDILTFSFPEQTGDATINAINHTVEIEVENGTVLTALVPTITVSANATINPLSGVARDFTNPVTYTVTAENGETQDWTVNVSIETSVPTTENSQLSIYPNPTSGLIKIETKQIIEKVSIIDLSGRIIQTTNQPEIDLSQIANGTYLISIKTHEIVYTEKIQITR